MSVGKRACSECFAVACASAPVVCSGEIRALYCGPHKLEGKRACSECCAVACLSAPAVCPGEMRALYCGPHKLEGMVNVDQERRTCNRSEHMPSLPGMHQP